MSKIKILIEGYAREFKDGCLASSTTCLVQAGGLNILVDPGSNKTLLVKRLSQEGLEIKDINIVFLTHYHLDHSLVTMIFEQADVLDGDTIYKQDKEIEYKGYLPGTNIKVIPTPGHAHEHASLIVSTNEGQVAIAGDIFWWMDDEEQKTGRKNLLTHKDPFVKDKKTLLESRKKILEMADFVIPGHGRMFKVEK